MVAVGGMEVAVALGRGVLLGTSVAEAGIGVCVGRAVLVEVCVNVGIRRVAVTLGRGVLLGTEVEFLVGSGVTVGGWDVLLGIIVVGMGVRVGRIGVTEAPTMVGCAGEATVLIAVALAVDAAVVGVIEAMLEG